MLPSTSRMKTVCTSKDWYLPTRLRHIVPKRL